MMSINHQSYQRKIFIIGLFFSFIVALLKISSENNLDIATFIFITSLIFIPFIIIWFLIKITVVPSTIHTAFITFQVLLATVGHYLPMGGWEFIVTLYLQIITISLFYGVFGLIFIVNKIMKIKPLKDKNT